METGPTHVSASIQYEPPSHTTSNGYGAHGYDFVSRMPTNSTYFLGQYPAHGYEYITNESYDWSSYVGTSPGNLESNRISSVSNGYPNKLTNVVACRGRKKVKEGSNRTSSMKGTICDLIYPSPPIWSADPSSVIKASRPEKKRNVGLGSSEAAAAATEDATPLDEVSASSKEWDDVSRIGQNVSSGECFEARQIWVIYDEDDGMPRLYCMVREVLFIQPFKIDIAYLSSKTDIEFGTMKWVQYGFTKSCGHFRIRNTDIVDHVNIFSHLLKSKKTGRGGCVRIFPQTEDIWAVYKNWSPNWNNSTPDEVRHKRDKEESKKWIPRREMLRFSHQVPSWFLKEETSGMPGNCWDLDPTAILEELLHNGARID
ncbi:unnamed protein product [Arabidopsis arenosa]|uniref:DUF3444 domain-containing protein n=1 Tax=Arabidopsis arenosa TaxID=38785 RepID=A0A8S2AVQ5_ARAAE|nr:unnamed protein product [Arabidopsis arenosa]